jgi:hypothetical protein
MNINGRPSQISKKDAEYQFRTVNVGLDNGEAYASGLRRPQHMHNYANFGGAVYELTIAGDR